MAATSWEKILNQIRSKNTPAGGWLGCFAAFPLVAAILAVLLLGEEYSVAKLAGIILIIGEILLLKK